MNFARTATTLLFVCACAAAPAFAATTGQPTERTYVTVDAQGAIVALNRASGKSRPLTAEETARLAEGIRQLVNQSTDGLVQIQHDDGSVSMDLQGRFQDVILARKNADGSVEQVCVDNPLDAALFFEIDPALVGAATAAASRAAAQPPIQ